MARPRNPKRDEAFQMWFESKGQMLLKDIAEQFDLSDSQFESGRTKINGMYRQSAFKKRST